MPGGKVEFWFTTPPEAVRVDKDELVVRSFVAFRFPDASISEMESAIRVRDERGYKIGMRLPEPQRLVRLAFRGENDWIELRESVDVTQELERAFGAVPNERWVGLVPESRLPRRRVAWFPDTIVYEDELTIAPFRYGPQLIPVVHTFAEESFERHYILGVRVLGTFRGQVRAGVQAGF